MRKSSEKKSVIERDHVEALRPRAIVWRMVIETAKKGYAFRMPSRKRFGSDLQLYFVFGAASVFICDHKPVRASRIARYLQIPPETARRHLDELHKMGLLEKKDGRKAGYEIGGNGRCAAPPDFMKHVISSAEKLIPYL